MDAESFMTAVWHGSSDGSMPGTHGKLHRVEAERASTLSANCYMFTEVLQVAIAQTTEQTTTVQYLQLTTAFKSGFHFQENNSNNVLFIIFHLQGFCMRN